MLNKQERHPSSHHHAPGNAAHNVSLSKEPKQQIEITTQLPRQHWPSRAVLLAQLLRARHMQQRASSSVLDRISLWPGLCHEC